MTLRERALIVFEHLHAAYPDAHCSLDYRTPLQLLVATILAAQCTDERVNIVSKTLFKKYKKAEDYCLAPREELEDTIRSCGFYHQKAKSIVRTCGRIIEEYGGKVPDSMEALLTLDGVGRKTANVILAECFGQPGIIVDTHCMRLSGRLGFTRETEPAKIEKALAKIWPGEIWSLYSHLFVFHGRGCCTARNPNCPECPVGPWCPSCGKVGDAKAKTRKKADADS